MVKLVPVAPERAGALDFIRTVVSMGAPLTAAVLRLSSPENRKYLNPARQPFPMQEIY